MTERLNDDRKREAMIVGDRAGVLEADEATEVGLLVDLLADPSTWAKPNPGLEDAIVRAVEDARPATRPVRTAVAADERRRPARRRRRFTIAALGAAAASIAVAGVMVVSGGGTGAGFEAQLTATALAPGAHASATIGKTDAGFRITLDAHGLPGLPGWRVRTRALADKPGRHRGTGRHLQLERRNYHSVVRRLARAPSYAHRHRATAGRRHAVWPTGARGSSAHAVNRADREPVAVHGDVVLLERRRQHGRLESKEDPPMHIFKRIGARPIGVATAAALAVGLVSAAPAFTASAAAAEPIASVSVVNGTLVVTGTNGPDVITLGADATTAEIVFDNDVANALARPACQLQRRHGVARHWRRPFPHEAPAVLGTKALTVDGGDGNDSINTGDGSDMIFGGNGDDRVDGGRGNDTVTLGNGNDFFVWTPGEGSDAVDGGNGQGDVMDFVGADGSETMSLSPNGSAAIFLRSPGNVRMDMSGIETLDVKALGGSDAITVNDVQRTSIRDTDIELAGVGGGTDKAADVVTVNGSDQPDRVNVSTQDGHIDVTGLQADTHITGSDPTLDQLQVKTLDGNDTVNVAPDVSTIIGVAVDLGLGQL